MKSYIFLPFLITLVLSACNPTFEVGIEHSSTETATSLTSTQTPIETSSETATEIVATEIPTETPLSSLVYTNTSYGFGFEYPSGWILTETIVPKGTDLPMRSQNRFNVFADVSDVLVVDVTKGPDWILEMVARPTPPSCGGEGPEPYNANNYQPLKVLGRNAVRLRPEKGYIWRPGDSAEPYPLPLEIIKLTGECVDQWRDEFIPSGEVVFLWDFGDSQIPLSIQITYYSSQFTDANLQNRTIDYSVIGEMDRIVESLKFLPVGK